MFLKSCCSSRCLLNYGLRRLITHLSLSAGSLLERVQCRQPLSKTRQTRQAEAAQLRWLCSLRETVALPGVRTCPASKFHQLGLATNNSILFLQEGSTVSLALLAKDWEVAVLSWDSSRHRCVHAFCNRPLAPSADLSARLADLTAGCYTCLQIPGLPDLATRPG